MQRLYARWADSVREPLIAYHLLEWRIGIEETVNLETYVHDELCHGAPLPEVPMIVLSAMGSSSYWAHFMTEQQMREAHDGNQSTHAMLAGSVPDGEHLHVGRSADVLDSILDVLARIG